MRAMAFSCALLLVAEVTFACEIIKVDVPQPSSRSARITIFVDGKPLPSARLSIQTANRHRPVFLDANGSVTLRDLPVGETCLSATDGNKRFSELCLVVSERSSNEVSDFGMNLETRQLMLFSPETRVDWVEQAPPAARVRTLKVTVIDANSAVISNAEIQIHKRGSYPQDPVKIIKTNEVGRFEGSVESGTYTLIFRMRGFRSELLSVEIAPDGKDIELRETLQIGSDCEW